MLLNRGLQKIDRALDLIQLVRLRNRMKSLESVLYNRKQRILNKFSKWNYLDEYSSLNSEDENSAQSINKLVGYKVSGKMDKRLL